MYDERFSSKLLAAARRSLSDTFDANAPRWLAGAGRPHAPRCELSAALATTTFIVQQVLMDEQEAMQRLVQSPFGMQAAPSFFLTCASLQPALLHVLQPVAQALWQQEDVAGMGQVLSAVASPADVAAALAAGWIALRGAVRVGLDEGAWKGLA